MVAVVYQSLGDVGDLNLGCGLEGAAVQNHFMGRTTGLTRVQNLIGTL